MKTLFIILFSLMFSIQGICCTAIQIKAKDKDKTIMVGRTMEFGPELASRLINSPRNKEFKTSMEDGTATLSWTAKYGYLFADGLMSGHVIDGMNEVGLSFGYLYLPAQTNYPIPYKDSLAQALPYINLGDWILGNFSSVAEAEKALAKITVFAEPLSLGKFKNVIFPLHAIISDKKGDSLVIEFIAGKMVLSKNPLGILTNSPTFDWHLNNLSNYANLSPYNPKPVELDGIIYAGNGQGSGLVGLPGDPTPPSRFVKMSLFQQWAMPVKNAKEALILANHILNNVDVPFGVVRGGKKPDIRPDTMDKTQWTVFKDLTHHVFYFRSYTNPTIQSIDLKKIDFSPNSKIFTLPLKQEAMFPDALPQFLHSTSTPHQHS